MIENEENVDVTEERREQEEKQEVKKEEQQEKEQNKENKEKIEKQTKKSEKEEEQGKQESKEKRPQRFVFNCIKGCGKCCERWDEVPVYISDIQRWINDGSLNYVLPFLQIKEVNQFSVQLVLKRNKKENDSNPSGCPLYDHENKICNLYYSMPIHCSAYPLAFNGQKYFLADKEECPGLGNGKMTKEWLNTCKSRAQEHYNSQGSTMGVLSILYGLILGHIMKKSQEAMEQLSEEDRKKIDKLLAKSKKEKEENTSSEKDE
ncbi:MAG: YkgJ family cysteine cluster protein [Candidatus Heimdallarchaeum endolithica]|uniref:YkgJ family cysteine cluster protein n=1 Tax=Candidatus Heimdallarchaeum endolithica TaxID=2876572 RepID=A0A9Y1BQ66_9ARCH|nr:MAG: YkgJ family cysteine cluster protein [Candidatus Heimdallarchaeum endolithica]